MIVTCSNCRARYAVDPLAIGPTGRTVQCARCNHRWFQRAEGPPPTPDIVIRPQPTATNVAAALPVPVPQPPEPSWARRLSIAAVVVLVVAAAGVAAYLHRGTLLVYADKIAARLPSELRFSRSTPAGHAPTSSPEGPAPAEAAAPAVPREAPKADAQPLPAKLEVDLAMSKIELVDGRYVVRGEVTNVGGSPGTTSKLVVTYKKGDDVLGTRSYPLRLGPIAAGGRQSFSQTLDNPPAGATDIVPSVE
ncbi:zinc-ribbon domain-containing protein [Enhydrobacter sp.]|jgi:predicted Zn finger-like uncharacterized protein|uniref:zinc-ribbon domain-containing protein n=1 Tax=Enhydrobacter sp. TaxID=1894999 RepID=UPI00261BA3D8|nr:zinc-ribbon domain-containing protein [Enhydrobacter sp.]WIM14324.1 MAG: hypothetical protein OJF58_005294 [Enhydrobacter sp.]